MVFGENLLENAYLLAGMVDHIEIVLFYTPTLHNFLSVGEIRALKKLRIDEDMSFSVHLPAFLEIASPDRKKREKSVESGSSARSPGIQVAKTSNRDLL